MKKIRNIFVSALLVLSLAGCTAEVSKPQTSQTVSETVTSQSETASETTTTVSVTETEAVTEETKSLVEEYGFVEGTLMGMTVEQKVGQIILAHFPDEDAKETMEKYQFAGYTLYAQNFKNYTPDDMKKLIKQVQEAAEIPAFLAVDEEGGNIVRVSKWPQYRLSPFSSQLSLAKGGEELIVSETEEKAQLLASLGLNLNLAPVADVTDDHYSYIYDRTFGVNAEKTGEYVSLVVNTMNENNMGSCLKHFPGYGSNEDTHKGLVIDDRSADSFENKDFIPFRMGIEAGVPAIMFSHNIVTAFDSALPASISPAVHDILRTELGFEGVIITDAMGMEGVTDYASEKDIHVLAVLAGNDLICTPDIEIAYNAILEAVNNGTIDEEMLNEKVRRVLEMKVKLGIAG